MCHPPRNVELKTMHYFQSRIINLKMTIRKTFGSRWMCHTSDTSKDDYRFPSRWGKEDRALPSCTNSIPHPFTPLHIQFHLNIFWELTAEDTSLNAVGTTNFQGRRKRSIKEKQKEEKIKNQGWKLTFIEWFYIATFVNIFSMWPCTRHNSLYF